MSWFWPQDRDISNFSHADLLFWSLERNSSTHNSVFCKRRLNAQCLISVHVPEQVTYLESFHRFSAGIPRMMHSHQTDSGGSPSLSLAVFLFFNFMCRQSLCVITSCFPAATSLITIIWFPCNQQTDGKPGFSFSSPSKTIPNTWNC